MYSRKIPKALPVYVVFKNCINAFEIRLLLYLVNYQLFMKLYSAMVFI